MASNPLKTMLLAPRLSNTAAQQCQAINTKMFILAHCYLDLPCLSKATSLAKSLVFVADRC